MKRKNLSIKYLNSIGACSEVVNWVKDQKDKNIEALAVYLFKEKDTEKLEWGNWLICRLLNKENKIRYACYVAKQCLKNYEKRYPNNRNLRNAVIAALNVVKNNTEKNRKVAWSAQSAACSAESAVWSPESAAQIQMQIKILRYSLKLWRKQ